MKKIYAVIICLCALAFNQAYAQTTFSGAAQTVIVETADSTMLLPASNAVPVSGIAYDGYSGRVNGWAGGTATWQIKITRHNRTGIRKLEYCR